MQHIFTAISDSSGEEYTISASYEGEVFVMVCTCQAGAMGQMCKHRSAILKQSDEASSTVREWFNQSKAFLVHQEIEELEKQAAVIKKLNSAKKAHFGRLMNEGC